MSGACAIFVAQRVLVLSVLFSIKEAGYLNEFIDIGFLSRLLDEKWILLLLLFIYLFIAPAGFWPLGQNPKGHPSIPRVIHYKVRNVLY